jgi:glutamate carboxypeptidase
MASERAERIRGYLEEVQDDAVHFLKRLVRAESPSDDPGSQARVQKILAAEFKRSRFRIRHVSGRTTGGHLMAVPRSRKKGAPIQLVVGHTDTVWPVGTLKNMPFEKENGRIRGPGVYDMKGGLTLLAFAFRALRFLKQKPEVTPVLFLNSDEEIGSPESQRHIDRLARLADRVFVLEPSLGRVGRLKTARKGVGEFNVEVRGRAAHSGLEPGRGVSAILELSHLVQRLFELNSPKDGISVNVGTIDGGLTTNVVAPDGRITVEVRVVTEEQGRDIEKAIRKLKPMSSAAKLEVTGGVRKPPLLKTERNRALLAVARAAGRELDLQLRDGLAGGASDGNTASVYAPTLDGLGVVGGGAHAVHEFMNVSSLAERGTLLALLLLAPPVDWTADQEHG